MKPFDLILADPPWSYSNKRTRGKAEDHYPTMTIGEICQMRVRDIAAPDSICMLWATPPLLNEGLGVLEAWGFDYKTIAFCWVKTNRGSGTLAWGLGNHTRSNVEIVLLGKRGKGLVRDKANVHQVVYAPRERHSAKPPIVRDRIAQLYGDVRRIELFARDKAKGWHRWGNEAPDGRDRILKW